MLTQFVISLSVFAKKKKKNRFMSNRDDAIIIHYYLLHVISNNHSQAKNRQITNTMEESLLRTEEEQHSNNNHQEEEEEEASSSIWFNKYYDMLATDRGSKIIILFWFINFLIGITNAKSFLDNTKDAIVAPSSSRAYADKLLFETEFPKVAFEQQLVVYVGAKNPEHLVCCPSTSCSKNCRGESEEIKRFYEVFSARLLNETDGLLDSYQSYYSMSGTELDGAKCTFASVHGNATIGLFTYDSALKKDRVHMCFDKIKQLFKELNPDPNKYTLGFTCVDAVALDGNEYSEKELVSVDFFTLPIAFFLFSVMVRSWRLLLICLLNAFLTLIISFGWIGIVIRILGLHPLTVATTMSEAIALSMSIDYSLFLARRFRDEIKNGKTAEKALRVTIRQAGEVVLLSCCTFLLVFVGFCFLPAQDFRGFGVVCIITLLTALTVNITLTLGLIHLFPLFFTKFSFNQTPEQMAELHKSAKKRNLGKTTTGKQRHHRGPPYGNRLYFRFLKFATTYPYNFVFIFVVYALMTPFAIRAFSLRINQDPSQISPRGVQSVDTYNALIENFDPQGMLAPMSFIVIARDNESVLTSSYFDMLNKFVGEVESDAKVDGKYILSLVVLQGKRVNFNEAKQLLNRKSLLCDLDVDLCSLYAYVWKRNVSPEKRASIVQVNLPFNVYSDLGVDFVDVTYKTMDRFMKENEGVQIALVGSEVDMRADMNLALNSFPALFGVTLVFVFLLLGVGFRSAFVPIRLLLTVFMPILSVFGSAVVVFQDGALSWTGWSSVRRAEFGFFWFIPVVCILQATGLVLDYDTFSVHRILEHRTDGYSMQAAIIKAMWEVNSTIVAAGLIMASVFGGLVLSQEQAVDQFGYILCVSVLFDTFVVQSLLMPAIMSFGSVWPRKVPMENLITIDDEEFR